MKEYSKAVKKADMILYTILIFWVSISIWASFASLEEVTSGQGRIIASSKIQIIQNLEGGIIDEIYVKSGDIVSKNEALLQLDTTRFVSELSALGKEKAAAEKNLSLLNEEKEILAPLVDQGVESRMELIRLLQRISDAEAQLLKTEEMEPILEDRLNRSTVKTPMDGIVNRVLVTTTGGVVQSGEPLAEIVPIEEEFLIEVEVSPKDIAYVLKGQEAIVKLTAFDFAKFGSMSGTVI
ncbi:MAG TPA: HlyD family efflux transporter periplasmic adaptor subunit, partial [Gammaproteobacteria bacterium]|nr:HlyD family efflux transporter periplasmic adaptor subunit [Gammaproteobacteria bacterium]